MSVKNRYGLGLTFQDLTDTNTIRGLIRYGRCWRTGGSESYREKWSFEGLEWCFSLRRVGLGLTWQREDPYAGDRDYLITAHVGPLALYFSYNAPKAHLDRSYAAGVKATEYGAEIHSRGCYLYLGHNPHEWSRSDPWWWEIAIHPRDLLLGKRKYSSEEVCTSRVRVRMPEGDYPATVKMERATWRRLRFPWWPLTKSVLRADIEPDIPIPVPGKGENSWDCGDDAIYSSVAPASSPEEAAENLRGSVMNTRIKYASAAWEPAEGWPAQGEV